MNDVKPRLLMICINRRFGADSDSCAGRGSIDMAEALEAGVWERRIDIQIERSVCMGQCMKGPAIRLAPGGKFILGNGLGDIDDILNELEARCGKRIEPDIPLNLPGS